MFPATLFNKLPALNRFWLKDVSCHHFWQYLYELKPLSCISHVQRLVQQAISVRIPSSKFLLEIHQFTNKTLIRSLLRIHPFNSTKVTTCPSEGMKLCTPISQFHLQGCALLKLGLKKGLPLRYDHISAVALWQYVIDACLGTHHNSGNVGLIVITYR